MQGGLSIDRLKRGLRRRTDWRALRKLRNRTENLLVEKFAGGAPVHFLHIGKTGGTAIKEALRHERWRLNCNLRLHDHGFKLTHVPVGEKAVFVLRDPASRFVSAFNSRKRMGMPLNFQPWRHAEEAAFKRFETPEDLALALVAADPDARAAAEAAMRGIQHVRDTLQDYLGDPAAIAAREDDILLIGLQENLGECFAQFKRLIGAPAGLSLTASAKRSHRGAPAKPLSAAAVAALRDWYAADYAILGHCRDLRRRRGWDAAPGA